MPVRLLQCVSLEVFLSVDLLSFAFGTSEEDSLCLRTTLSCAMIVPQFI